MGGKLFHSINKFPGDTYFTNLLVKEIHIKFEIDRESFEGYVTVETTHPSGT